MCQLGVYIYTHTYTHLCDIHRMHIFIHCIYICHIFIPGPLGAEERATPSCPGKNWTAWSLRNLWR